ncbi:ABC transporter substrate-binding protein [Bifidobacterium bifidum]|uniref:ABC transporter substrate-binding protein n=1 Tax=Bifidobacterium bifidum TaxID=1681 RepID=UPI0032DECA69
MRTDFTYLSYTAYANSIAVDSIGQSYHGKLTLHEALQQWGESLKKYGEEEGFTVQ